MRAWTQSPIDSQRSAMVGPADAFPTQPFPSDNSPDSQAALFHVLLDADSAVDEVKLRRAAAAGVPPSVRPLVWRMLLRVTSINSPDGLANEQKRTRDYEQLAADPEDHSEPARKIRNVLKRSRSAYQPSANHDKRPGKQGSTSGESYDGEDDDNQTPALLDLPQSNGAVKANGKTVAYVRGSHNKLRVVDREIIARFTRVIGTYLEAAGDSVEFHSDMVFLCAPFIEIMPTESDAYYAFNALMQSCHHIFTEEGLQEAVSQFMTMLRFLHQDLHDHFVSEEVELSPWVAAWLRGLLVQQLPRRSLLRLWDSYFANLPNQGLDLHPFVCLVFIDHIKAELQECDDGERITALLAKLRPLDIDYVIAHALSIREQLRERDIL